MAKTQVKRVYRYRSYPTAQQRGELLRTFGCVRKVYALVLDARTRAWFTEQRRVSYTETSALLTEWKRCEELSYLGEVSSVPLQQALRHLQTAFANFFARQAHHPRFKSRKKSRQSAEYTKSASTWRDGRLKLVKMGEPLHIVWSRPLPEGTEPTTVTVSRDAADRWFVSVLVETVVEHQVTTRLVRDSQTVVIEDLRVRNVLGNHTLARAVSGAAWSKFRMMLEYKAEWYGREVIAVDRWFPPSKTCSACGRLADALPLSVRTWACAGCGTVHDRNVNAATNIKAAGLAVSACGAGVRPQRESSRTGQSAGKQERSGASRKEIPTPQSGE